MNFFLKLFQFILTEYKEMEEVDTVYFTPFIQICGGTLDEYNFEIE